MKLNFRRNMGWTQVYLSDLLPELKVRFISINDNIDSNAREEYYDELDVKLTAMMYEHYAIEGSKKVKQIKHMQQLSGQYIGVSAPYGYLKDSKDSHKLIVDKYASEMIREILNNEVYIGNMVQGKVTKPRRKSNKRVKTKKEDWIVVENTHEAIISKEDFENVQRILNYSPLTLKSDDILLRYLECPDCGSKFYKKKTRILLL